MATSQEFLEQMLLNDNVKAAALVVAHTEGTSAEDGYSYLFGSRPDNTLRFTDFSIHPNNHQVHNGINSTAAGRYQILFGTYVELCNKYGFTNFEPHTQDLMFAAILDGISVLTAVSKGLMLQDLVLNKMAKQWASLPGSPYGQPTHTVADVREVYLANGGSIGGLA